MKMQTTAKLRQLRVAPRKVRLVVDLIRGMSVKDALVQLQFSPKHSARPVMKLLQSAMANAKHNHEMDTETLVVKTAFVDGGPTLHRWMPRAMGRATKLRKRTSHITLILEGDVVEKKAPAKKEVKEKAEATEETKKPAAKKPAKKTAAKKPAAKKEAKK
jgi:large subunit ribosomal protein L22